MMLSRFAFRGKDLVKYLISRHQSSVATPPKCQPIETNQRDYVNFPDYVRPEYPPPHRLGLIPYSWFEFFYSKTGVTGPYMFLFGVSTYCLSKEIIILEHQAGHFVSAVMACSFITYKFGDKIAEFHDKVFQKSCDTLDSVQKEKINQYENFIEDIKKKLYPREFVNEIDKCNKEIVYFQMEASYRKRLAEVYDKVKKCLDYQMAIESIDRSFTQKNLIDYVVKNVLSSITPEKEQMVLDKCILDLNALAEKA